MDSGPVLDMNDTDGDDRASQMDRTDIYIL